ncbi:MAG TPA: GGDEF domain-containing protein [Sphingomonas sp.]|nr:GGDEF domain-containing protein [Sphingomonas sp.]
MSCSADRSSHDPLVRLFDWLTALPADEAARYRDDILATAVLGPFALLTSGLGVLMTSLLAMLFTRAPWAAAWFMADVVLLGARFAVAWRYQKRGGAIPHAVARRTILLACAVFVLFSAGCTASLLTAIRPLPMIATASMMGLVAGLATRWAALPRLGIFTIVVYAAPFSVAGMMADGGAFVAGAVQFVIVTVGTAALTLQNNRTLVAMLRAEHKARTLAETDVLTTLPNRAALLSRLHRRNTAPVAATLPTIALLFVDLDRFKAINDAHGHSAGDAALIALGRRIAEAAAPHFACRLGGDEFVVMVEGGEVALAATIARRVADALAEPLHGIAPQPIVAGGSVGIAFGAPGRFDSEQLLAEADAALYVAKRSGGDSDVVVAPARRASAA